MSEQLDRSGDLIHGLFCPMCGYDMTGHEHTSYVTCPECGERCATDDLWVGPPPNWLVRTLKPLLPSLLMRIVVVGVIAVVGIGVLLPPMGTCRCGPGLTQRESNLRNISSAAFTYATENNDLMPAHLSDLVIDGYLTNDIFVDPEIDQTNRNASFHFVALKSIDHTPEQRALVMAAMELKDASASFYQFGDVFFPRFPTGWRMSQFPAPEVTLQYWTLPNEDGERTASFFDGHIETIDKSRWREVWLRDTQERIQMGVPVLSNDVLKDNIQ